MSQERVSLADPALAENSIRAVQAAYSYSLRTRRGDGVVVCSAGRFHSRHPDAAERYLDPRLPHHGVEQLRVFARSPHAMMVGCAVTTCYLTVTNTLAVLQLGNEKARFTAADRGFLAALLHRLPQEAFTSAAIAGTPGHDPALASPPGRTAACRQVHAEVSGSAGAFRPRSRLASGVRVDQRNEEGAPAEFGVQRAPSGAVPG